MTTAVPPGSGPSAPTQGDNSLPSTPLSWEGDRMFNIYIYDYCHKRGFLKTARELLAEAEIPPDSTPPINARQGLLFEWWSVFWVLFTAKSNGVGTDDAVVYTQHQAQRQAQQRMNPQAAQMGRFVSGMQRPGMMSNGPMPNGVGSAALTGPGPIPTGGQGPGAFPMPGPGPQVNGIPGGLPAPGGSSSGPQSFGQLQRPPPIGSQQRGPNGMPPFQSPTMSHSPQNHGGAPLQQHSQAPMGQLGPSPHLTHRGGMLPPNGMQGMNNPTNMGAAQTHTPTPGFQQLGRPPSRSATPGQNPMIPHPSPSLVARLPPGGMTPDMRAQDAAINIELGRIGHQNLIAIKQEAGLGEKDMLSFTLEDKQRILAMAKARGGSRNVKPGAPGATNAAAGPSGSNPSMHPPNQRNQHQQQRGNKRSSTSPGEEHETLPRNDTSPPDRKRLRRSPIGVDQQQAPLTPMSYPHPPPQGGPGGPQQLSNNMMRGPMSGPPMNGFPHPPGMPNLGNNPGMGMQLGQGMGVPQMGNAMSPGMNHPGPGGMMVPQMTQQMQMHAREAQYRQSMHSLHKGLAPGNVLNSALPGAGSPSASDPSFNPGGPQGQGPQFSTGPGNRMNQSKPMGMMPPPSPAMNGPPKDQSNSKDNKGTNSNQSNSHPEGSPRNAPNSGQQGQGPTNPANPGQGGTAPATPVPGSNQNMTAPSPSAILGNPPSMNQSSTDLFSSDFIQSVASSLDEFDPSIFRSDGDINFERDFGQWFNPDDVGSLDLK